MASDKQLKAAKAREAEIKVRLGELTERERAVNREIGEALASGDSGDTKLRKKRASIRDSPRPRFARTDGVASRPPSTAPPST